MRVAEVVVAEPQFVVTGQTVEHAAKRMITHDLRLLPVCRSEGTIVGAVTARDIVKAVAQSRAPELCRVDDVMTSDYASCRHDDATDEVYRRMVSHGIEEMVVENSAGKRVGIVDRDFLAAIAGPVVLRPVHGPRKLA